MTLKKRIIPCLDIDQGRVVKGTNFVNLRDAGDPIELAKEYDRQGADELVFLDITATVDKRSIILDLVRRCASEIFIPFTVGGGIQDIESMREILNAGADKISINTAAVKNSLLIQQSSKHFGSQCIVVAVDVRKVETPTSEKVELVNKLLPKEEKLTENSKWEVYTHGGRNRTGIDAVKWAEYMVYLGAGELLVTSMDADGTKTGYDIDVTKTISQKVSVPVIASGGAGTKEHIVEALNCCEAALLASLLHFQELSIPEIKTYCEQNGISIRK